MTRHTCISRRIYYRPHGLATGLFWSPNAARREVLGRLHVHVEVVKSAVTFLMWRAAPSNFTFKWPAGRLPLPGLKPLLSP